MIHMALYCIKIYGTNGSRAWASCGDTTLYASPPSVAQVDVVRFDAEFPEESKPALFADKEQAQKVALACHWNNQQFEVCAARGHVRSEGVVVSPMLQDWRSCQEAWTM